MAERQGPLTTAAKLLGRKGGKRGGPARAEALTKARRIQIARMGRKAQLKKKQMGGG